jgi:hypothetical protein
MGVVTMTMVVMMKARQPNSSTPSVSVHDHFSKQLNTKRVGVARCPGRGGLRPVGWLPCDATGHTGTGRLKH